MNRPIELLKLKLREYYSSERIRRVQEKKLRGIISYAYDHVPYYKTLFTNAGLRPEDIRTIEDLKKIPILTKENIRKNYHEIISSDYLAGERGLTYVATSGSSGTQLKIAFNEEEMARGYLFLNYGYFKCGVRPFMKIAHIRVFLEQKNERKPKAFGVLKKYAIDLKSGPSENVKELNSIRPHYIYSYPSYLALMAKSIFMNNTKLLFRPRGIFTNGEILIDQTRGLIGRAFKCPVKDTYGSAEFCRMAFECKYGNLHIIPDSVIIEIDNNESDKSIEGEAIITSLYHRTMPLIRYKIGDRILLSTEQCRCGLNYAIIKKIIGRSDDYIVLPSGRVISAMSINQLDNISEIVEYQIIQKKRDYFEVLVRPDSVFSDKTVENIKNIIRTGCLGEDVKINVTMTDDIKRSSTGKLMAVISEVGAAIDRMDELTNDK